MRMELNRVIELPQLAFGEYRAPVDRDASTPPTPPWSSTARPTGTHRTLAFAMMATASVANAHRIVARHITESHRTTLATDVMRISRPMFLAGDKREPVSDAVQLAARGLRGKPVELRHCPATVPVRMPDDSAMS